MLVTVDGRLRSDATNAYALLDDVATVVSEEPSLVWMHGWLINRHQITTRPPTHPRYAVCHTAGCIAGWITMLTARDTGFQHPATAALSMLGVPDANHDPYGFADLFDGTVMDQDGDDLEYGEPGYAAAVIRRIRRFQFRFRDRLLNTPVAAPVPVGQESELVGV